MAALFGVIAGRDPRDATSASGAVPDYTAALTGNIDGLRVGVPRALLDDGVEPGIREAFEAALREMTDAGAIVTDIALPHAALAIPVYYLVANAEASSNLARYDGVRYGSRADGSSLTEMYYRTRGRLGAEVKRRIMIGTFVLSAGYYDAYYVKAQQVRALIRKDYDEAFAHVDVVALPTSPTVAFRLGARTADPIQMYLSDVFTAAANLAGLPAISIPCGLTGEKLPAGFQLTGRPFDETTLLRAAAVLERRIVMPRPDAGSL
jgi:aspartyl-tRNA(Asn)/glutamyl-tRNA(Gln) amidotransferase subunit A